MVWDIITFNVKKYAVLHAVEVQINFQKRLHNYYESQIFDQKQWFPTQHLCAEKGEEVLKAAPRIFDCPKDS